jgi:hypothetical protein
MDKTSVKEEHVTYESRSNTGGKTILFFFQLSRSQMQDLAGYSSFEKNLLSSLAHTLRLGIYLEQKIKGAARDEIDLTAPGASACTKYIETALKSDLAADRYFSIRLSGPSMRVILCNVPP